MTQSRPEVDDALVRCLLDDQFPQWAELPLDRVTPGGSDHWIYRLGSDLTVRVPAHAGAIHDAEKDLHWLPLLARALPMRIPNPIAVGEPGFGYPWNWSVGRWLDGSVATPDVFGDSIQVADSLAGFLRELHGFDADLPDEWRPLLDRPLLCASDPAVRSAIAATASQFDAAALSAVWEQALLAESESWQPRWVHGDFHPGNLLAQADRITTVLDFGSFGFGDPAADLMIAYTLMTPRVRRHFARQLDLDAGAWVRGRGWSLRGGILAYAAYADTRPDIAAATTRQITQVLAD